MDLNGVYDFEFRKISWSSKVLKMKLASPYLIAFLKNNTIEIRNIFNPNLITQNIKMGKSDDAVKFMNCHACTAQNLIKRYNSRLDDFCIIYKSTEGSTIAG